MDRRFLDNVRLSVGIFSRSRVLKYLFDSSIFAFSATQKTEILIF